MAFRSSNSQVWVMLGFALVGVAFAVVFTTGESDWHPTHGSLWQSHYWLIGVPGGALGLEEWRLEGINTETTVCLGSFYFSVSLPAAIVAAIGLVSVCTVGLLCYLGCGAIFRVREYDAHAA
jgi:hypothetical protein